MRHSASSWDKDTKKDTVDDTNVRNSATYVGCVNQSLQIRILASIFMLVGLVIGWTNSSFSETGWYCQVSMRSRGLSCKAHILVSVRYKWAPLNLTNSSRHGCGSTNDLSVCLSVCFWPIPLTRSSRQAAKSHFRKFWAWPYFPAERTTPIALQAPVVVAVGPGENCDDDNDDVG